LAASEHTDGWTEHRVGSGLDLPFADDSLDACRCERVLQHLIPIEGARAVSEAKRVLRPGGRLVLLDTDWATLSIHSPDPALERRLVQLRILGWRNAFAARGMPELLIRLGLRDVATETSALRLELPEIDFLMGATAARALSSGQITSWEWATWRRSLHQIASDGAFYASVNMVLCYGTRAD
jgi:SAM-dependent methyltransferase